MIRFFTYIGNNYKKPAIILGILGILSSVTSVIMSYCLKYSVDCIFRFRIKTAQWQLCCLGLWRLPHICQISLGRITLYKNIRFALSAI